MNEISISSAIAKLHSILLSFFLFLLTIFIILFIWAINGIHIDSFELSNLKVKQLYIKWDEKFTIHTKSIEIITSKKKSKEKEKTKQLKEFFNFLRNVRELSDLVKEVDIKHFRFNDYQFNYKFKEHENSYLKLHSKNMELNATLKEENNQFLVDINKFQVYNQGLYAQGKIVFDNKKELIASKLNINILDDANLTAYLYMDTHKLHYSIVSNNTIHHLPQIIKNMKLPNYINKWVYDAVTLKDANLHTFYGSVHINKPENIIKYIHADANLTNVTYKFNTDAEAVNASDVHLSFENAVLGIHLHNGFFHNQQLQKSYLDIDLDPNKYLLHLYLYDMLSLDKDVLDLLHTYDIEIPFMQTSSKIDTKLYLKIKLEGLDTNVDGSFAIQNGTFLYKNLNLNASNGLIKIHGQKVNIEKLNLSYKDNIDTNVSGYLIPKNNQGHLNINMNKLSMSGITLNKKQPSIHLSYDLGEKEDMISVSPSQLHYKENELDLNAFNIKFNLKTFFAQISPFRLTIPGKVVSDISGTLDLDKLISNLNLKISQLQLNNIKLNQNTLDVAVTYNNQLQAKIASKSHWKFKDNLMTLSPVNLTINQQKLKIDSTKIDISDLLTTNASLQYDLNQTNGSLALQNVMMHNKFLNAFFNSKDTYKLAIDNSTKDTQIFFNQYNTKLILQENNLWVLKCQDFNKI